MKLFSLAGTATALALLAAMPAAADMVIIQGNNPQPDENILLGNASGNLVVGTSNQTGFLFNIEGQEALASPSNGQARVTSLDAGFTTLDFSLAEPNFGFASLILNLDATANGSVTFTTLDQLGNTGGGTFNLDDSGQNFFTLTAINGQLFTNVSFLSTVDVADVAQIRVGGFTEIDDGGGETGVIPEPGTWALMIVGFGSAGAMLRRRRLVVA